MKLPLAIGIGINNPELIVLQPIERAAWYIGQGLFWLGLLIAAGLFFGSIFAPRK